MDASLESVVQVEQVTFRYAPLLGGAGTVALQDVSLNINAGDVFGLIGPNGAGKTTLVRLILGLLPLQTGRVCLWDSDMPIAGSTNGPRVGYVPEKLALYDFLTAEELLDFHAQLLGEARLERKQHVQRLLEESGLAAHAQRRIGGYSKGMHQRLAVAQALLGDPQLLILDEPTDGLDPIGRKEVLALLGSLQRRGKTILINSHQLHEIEKLCNRYALLVDGRIASTGSMEEIRDRAPEGQSLEEFFLTTVHNSRL
jgi:ABC-2 type transport system ATP-binding protein